MKFSDHRANCYRPVPVEGDVHARICNSRLLERGAGDEHRLRPRLDLPGDPVRAVGRDLERDPGALHSPNLATLRKQSRLRWESADPATENEREQLGLALVGVLLDQDASASRYLTPRDLLPSTDADEAEPVENDIARSALAGCARRGSRFTVAVYRRLANVQGRATAQLQL